MPNHCQYSAFETYLLKSFLQSSGYYCFIFWKLLFNKAVNIDLEHGQIGLVHREAQTEGNPADF